MKATKKQLRRIIREAIKGSPAAGPNTGRPYIDVAMGALSSGDIDSAAQAILSSYHMDDTWVSEEEALEDQLAALGTAPSQEDVEATAAAWLDGYRSGKFKPAEDQYEDQWSRGAERSRSRSKRNAPAWDDWRKTQGLANESKRINLNQLRGIIKEEKQELAEVGYPESFSAAANELFKILEAMSPEDRNLEINMLIDDLEELRGS